MKAISLWQPWASLWVAGVKVHETRHWFTTHRGPLLVHAAKKMCADVDHRLAEILVRTFGARWANELPRGALIGCVELATCQPTTGNTVSDDERACGNWEPGRYAWRAQQPYRFCEPIAYTGRQGFFDVPADVVSAALAGRSIAAPPPQGQLRL
jgi:activating signal cointegrator 1